MEQPTLRLRVEPAHGEPFERLFDQDVMVVGRSSASDLALDDPFLSRHHARFFRSGDKVLVEDLGSRNGTLLNGVQIKQPTAVMPGDEIRLSSSTIKLREPRSATRWDSTASDFGATIFRPATEMLGKKDVDPASFDDTPTLRRYAERLHLLNDLHEALSRSLTQQELLDLILERAFEHLRPEHGVIMLRQPDGSLDHVALRTTGAHDDLPISRSLSDEVCGKGMAALVLDAATDSRFAEAQSIIMTGMRSFVAAPFLDQDQALGMIVLSSRAGEQYGEGDLELLVSLASIAAMKIRNQALAEEAVERRKLEAQMALARRIQLSLLPDELPVHERVALFAENHPSLTVSGDHYEVVERQASGDFLLVIADVSGKGMPAALLATSLEALAAGPIDSGGAPEEICTFVSRQLFRRTPPERYATAIVASYQPSTGVLRYTNAGHNPGLVVKAGGGCAELGSTGMPLGLLESATFTTGETRLDVGDTLVLYTDGLVEAENPDDERFGLERLKAAAVELRDQPPPEFVFALEGVLDRFVAGRPYGDDRTLLVARRLA